MLIKAKFNKLICSIFGHKFEVDEKYGNKVQYRLNTRDEIFYECERCKRKIPKK